MARRLPEAIHFSKRTGAEADLLARIGAELGDEWTVLHSLNLGATERTGELEADFVLLHPRGRITLELKGGAVTCEEGRWFSHGGGRRHPIKPPFRQAAVNSHEIQEHLRRVLGADSPAANAPFTHAVVFPSCEFDSPTIEAPRERTLDRRALARPLGEVIPPLLDLAERQREGRKPGSPTPPPLEPGQIAAVVAALRPDLRLVPNLSSGEFDAHLSRLSAEQLAAFGLMEGNARLRITGGAGTGKTLLALEACRRAAEAGARRVGLVCFNRNLGRHLAAQVEAAGLAGRIEAGSLFLQMDRLLGEEALPPGLPHARYAERARRAAEAAEGLSDAEKFDLLVVDEGQDLRVTPDHLRLLDGSVRGGFAGGRWRWFEDAGQALVFLPEPPPPHPVADAALRELQAAPLAHLTRNWRNADPVARAFAKVAKLPHGEMGFEGPAVSLAVAREGKARDYLEALLEKVVLPRHRAEEVVLLSARGAGRESFAGLATLAGCRLVPFDSLRPAQPGELRVDTVGRFKGMESHAVVLADLDRLGSERERRAAYVGMSRAKYALYLLAGPEAADQLRDALG